MALLKDVFNILEAIKIATHDGPNVLDDVTSVAFSAIRRPLKSEELKGELEDAFKPPTEKRKKKFHIRRILNVLDELSPQRFQ